MKNTPGQKITENQRKWPKTTTWAVFTQKNLSFARLAESGPKPATTSNKRRLSTSRDPQPQGMQKWGTPGFARLPQWFSCAGSCVACRFLLTKPCMSQHKHFTTPLETVRLKQTKMLAAQCVHCLITYRES